jgi:hypothetical protein
MQMGIQQNGRTNTKRFCAKKRSELFFDRTKGTGTVAISVPLKDAADDLNSNGWCAKGAGPIAQKWVWDRQPEICKIFGISDTHITSPDSK